MSRLSLCLGSLLLAGSLLGCATTTTTTPRKPDVVGATQVDRTAVRAKLAARRAVTVARFLAYREARVYPINNLGSGRHHVWVDDWGNLCAAATIISGDWGREATVNAGKQDREQALANITTGPLADWILMSGLTHHEIVAIQVPSLEIGFPDERGSEIERLYGVYVDVERQLATLTDENLDLAVDALMKRPDLARALVNDRIAGPGPFAAPVG